MMGAACQIVGKPKTRARDNVAAPVTAQKHRPLDNLAVK